VHQQIPTEGIKKGKEQKGMGNLLQQLLGRTEKQGSKGEGNSRAKAQKGRQNWNRLHYLLSSYKIR